MIFSLLKRLFYTPLQESLPVVESALSSESQKRTSLTPQKTTGNWAETLAAEELKKKGYKITKRNWMSGADELDIIALDERQVVFVEVRARKFNARVPGAQSLNRRKHKALRRAAISYLRTLPEEPSWRFDVIEISYRDKENYELFHYEGVQL